MSPEFGVVGRPPIISTGEAHSPLAPGRPPGNAGGCRPPSCRTGRRASLANPTERLTQSIVAYHDSPGSSTGEPSSPQKMIPGCVTLSALVRPQSPGGRCRGHAPPGRAGGPREPVGGSIHDHGRRRPRQVGIAASLHGASPPSSYGRATRSGRPSNPRFIPSPPCTPSARPSAGRRF